jgi:tetratricopeptide (TPR) repeat protein
MKDMDAAIEYYKLTLQAGEPYPYYFAASAALQLGLIYEQQKNPKQARFYFEKCISLKNHQYRNSLSQKAKAGINRLPASGDN